MCYNDCSELRRAKRKDKKMVRKSWFKEVQRVKQACALDSRKRLEWTRAAIKARMENVDAVVLQVIKEA